MEREQPISQQLLQQLVELQFERRSVVVGQMIGLVGRFPKLVSGPPSQLLAS